MLATRLYSVIKENRELSSILPFKQLNLKKKSWVGPTKLKQKVNTEKNVSSQERTTTDGQKHKSLRTFERPFPCSFLYPLTPYFFRGKTFPVLTHEAVNVTTTLSTQRACLWETSHPLWYFPVQLLFSFCGQWLSEGIIYLLHKTALSLGGYLKIVKTVQKYMNMNRPLGQRPSSYLFSSLLTHHPSSETTHNGLQ